MPETKRPLKVFLCHAHDDKLKTRELYRYLRKRGIQPWLDAEDLVGGQDWRVEIPKAIKASDAIIICLSKNSINKEGFVQAEITFALEKALEVPQGRIFIIPARFEDCEVPDNLERFHYVDLFEENGFPKLMKSLKTRAGQLERSTVQVPQPNESSPNLTSAPKEKVESEAAVEKIERGHLNENVAKIQPEILKQLPSRKNNPDNNPTDIPILIKKPSRKQDMQIVVALISLVGTIIAALLGSPLIGKWLAPVFEPTITSTITFTFLPLTYTKTATYTPVPAFTYTFTPTVSSPFIYTVQDGDALPRIVEKFDLGEDGILLILFLNPYDNKTGKGINPATQDIYPGQQILIPNPNMKLPTTTPVPQDLPRGTKIDYTVQVGDRLSSIAQKFNSTEDAILKENIINDPNILFVGQVLTIPVNIVTPTATRPPTSTSKPGPGAAVPSPTLIK